MSESLYNKYRPQTFEDVAQPQVVKVLEAQIRKNKHVSTYLLHGPSGTGKTTLARIMGMALLCENRKDNESNPCGYCSNCLKIQRDNHRDYIEIDCAQNGKVEDVRELISERMRLAPEGKYRIIVLDESHMLTTQSQNALLKAMEEPPPFVVFFLCSSEPHKILSTIRTRCQKHTLTRVSDSSLLSILKKVVEQEGVIAEDSALDLIVEESQGSAREALVILEQVCVLDVNETTVREVLLRGPKKLSYDLLESIALPDRAKAYQLIETAQKEGRDFCALLNECARILMLIVKLKLDPPKDRSKIDPQLITIAKLYSGNMLLAGTQSLIEITSKIRQNVPVDLVVPVGILKTIEQMAKIKDAAKAST